MTRAAANGPLAVRAAKQIIAKAIDYASANACSSRRRADRDAARATVRPAW